MVVVNLQFFDNMRFRITLLLFLALPVMASSQSKYTIYPVPHSQEVTAGTASFTKTVTIVAGEGIDDATIQRAKDVLAEGGLTALVAAKPVKQGSNIILAVNGASDIAAKIVMRSKLDGSVFQVPKYDRHILSLNADRNGDAQLLVLGENTDAVFCGLASLEQMLDGGARDMQCVNIYDYADIRDRGVIEGYYGVPYSADVTKDLFRFMARYKMNTYVYGAKSDPYHSRFWSEPYPESITPEEQKIGMLSSGMLHDITEVAHASKVNFVWAIHPGNAFTDSTDKDVNSRIMAKYEKMYDLGVRQFAVFVDDVGVPYDKEDLDYCAKRLSDLQDLVDARWNVAGAAPADTVKPLQYVPQLYAYSWTTRENAHKFFASLSNTPSKISIFITGRAVWTVPNNYDISLVNGFLGREVSWWWNYPCNDNDMTKLFTMDIYSNFKDEKHIDNLARLEPLEGTKTLIINPMQQGEVSKITLFSVADYSWNVEGFNNDRSWEAALPAVVGKEKAADLRTLAPYLRYFDADALKYSVANYKRSVEEGKPRPQGLIGRMNKLREACASLQALSASENESDRLLYGDMRPWLNKLDAMAAEILALLNGDASAPVDYENDPRFQFEVLNGMGEDIELSILTAEPSGEILYPFIIWLRTQSR